MSRNGKRFSLILLLVDQLTAVNPNPLQNRSTGASSADQNPHLDYDFDLEYLTTMPTNNTNYEVFRDITDLPHQETQSAADPNISIYDSLFDDIAELQYQTSQLVEDPSFNAYDDIFGCIADLPSQANQPGAAQNISTSDGIGIDQSTADVIIDACVGAVKATRDLAGQANQPGAAADPNITLSIHIESTNYLDSILPDCLGAEPYIQRIGHPTSVGNRASSTLSRSGMNASASTKDKVLEGFSNAPVAPLTTCHPMPSLELSEYDRILMNIVRHPLPELDELMESARYRPVSNMATANRFTISKSTAGRSTISKSTANRSTISKSATGRSTISKSATGRSTTRKPTTSGSTISKSTTSGSTISKSATGRSTTRKPTTSGSTTRSSTADDYEIIDITDDQDQPTTRSSTADDYEAIGTVDDQHQPATTQSYRVQHEAGSIYPNTPLFKKKFNEMTLLGNLYLENGAYNQNFFDSFISATTPLSKCFSCVYRSAHWKDFMIERKPNRISTFSYQQILSAYFLNLRGSGKGLRNSKQEISVWNIWVCLNRLLILESENDKFDVVTREPLITNFYLSMLTKHWGKSDVEALAAHIKERARVCPSPPIEFITRNAPGTTTGLMANDRLEQAKEYFEDTDANERTLRKMIIHLNTLFTTPAIRDAILELAPESMKDRYEPLAFEVWLDAFTSGDYVYPLFEIFTRLGQLGTSEDPIHIEYYNKLSDLLETLQNAIHTAISTNGRFETKDYPNRVIGSIESNQSELFKRVFTTNFTFNISNLRAEWIKKLDNSGRETDVYTKHIIVNGLASILSAAKGVILLLEIISKRTKPTRICHGVLSNVTFECIVFDSLNDERLRMLCETYLYIMNGRISSTTE